MRGITALVTLLCASVGSAQGPWLSKEEQTAAKNVWPASVEMPANMRFYRPTNYTQRLATTGGRETNFLYRLDQDDFWTNAPPALNPNRLFPWAVAGGLHEAGGWGSRVGIAIPEGKKLKAWQERVDVPLSARPLPKVLWSFPDGTVLADLLFTRDAVFELRLREKVNGKWRSSVPFRDLEVAPKGYTGPGKRCAECHDQAGSQLQYGIGLRGSDGAFTPSPLVEGTLTLDSENWPLESGW
jgi:hypothetical protein